MRKLTFAKQGKWTCDVDHVEDHEEEREEADHDLISQKAFIKSFCKSQFPHKFGNLSFLLTNAKDKLTDL